MNHLFLQQNPSTKKKPAVIHFGVQRQGGGCAGQTPPPPPPAQKKPWGGGVPISSAMSFVFLAFWSWSAEGECGGLWEGVLPSLLLEMLSAPCCLCCVPYCLTGKVLSLCIAESSSAPATAQSDTDSLGGTYPGVQGEKDKDSHTVWPLCS